MQKCGLLNYFRKVLAALGQIENASAKYVMIDDKSRQQRSIKKKGNEKQRRHNVAMSQCARRICPGVL